MGGQYGIRVLAYDHSPVTGLKVADSEIDGVDVPMELKHVKDPVFRICILTENAMTHTKPKHKSSADMQRIFFNAAAHQRFRF
ncbi:hypothetical protein PO124_07905 [Bacillus licheniformis]|nr:hypothetical protein [Bacillus licheniformis]